MGAWDAVYNGLTLLNTFRFGVAAVSSGAIAIPAREQLVIQVLCAGFNAGDFPALRFNADAGNNYYSRHISFAAGGVVAVNNPTNSVAQLGLSALAATGSRMMLVAVQNVATIEKLVTVNGHVIGTGAVATSPSILFGGGSWVNTVNQITSVELRSGGGVSTFNAGSSIAIYGVNP